MEPEVDLKLRFLLSKAAQIEKLSTLMMSQGAGLTFVCEAADALFTLNVPQSNRFIV